MSSKYFIILFLFFGLFEASGQNIPNTAISPAGTATHAIAVPPALSATIQPNWTRTFEPQEPETNEAYINGSSNPTVVRMTTVYMDGFNRPVQSVQHFATSGNRPHLITPYDTRFLSEKIDFLPYAAAEPDYDKNLFTTQRYYYSSKYAGEDYTPYSISKNISTTQQRAIKELSPGLTRVGQNRGLTTKLVSNAAGEVKMWQPDGDGKPVYLGIYEAGMLSGECAFDTMGAFSTVYRDRNGRVVCKVFKQEDKNVGGGGTITIYGTIYYVYDALGRLVCTMPPKASAASTTSVTPTVFTNLCHRYKYDSKGRLAAQCAPGEADYTEVVYDQKDRIIMRRTPNEKAAGQWEVSFYDQYSRPKATSLINSTTNRQGLQDVMDAGTTTTNPADLRYYLLTPQGETVYPAENALSNNTMMSYTYYDDYALSDPGDALWTSCSSTLMFTETLNGPGAEIPLRSTQTQGKITGSRVRIIKAPGANAALTGEWRQSANYYDSKGRIVFTASRDLYQGNMIHAHYRGTQYHFTNKVLITKHVMQNMNGTPQQRMELDRYDYDELTGRLSKSWRRTDTSIWVVQATYSYDNLGRKQRKVLGNWGEVQDYSYDIRGQLTGINDYYTLTGDKQGESRSFGQSLRYDYGFTDLRYDGKITGMMWRGSQSTYANAYGYSYDYAGRLTNAEYRRFEPGTGWSKSVADYTVSNLTYDRDGNLKSMLQRTVKPGGGVATMDRLTYIYEDSELSNRLNKVIDSASSYELGDFINPNGTNTDYTYDPNGNLNLDNNKGITQITYTYFNKPQTISFSGGRNIQYSYDAAGNKLQELINDSSSVKRKDYIGNYVYENNNLLYATTDEGRSVWNGTLNRFTEQYFVKDHLDNVRSAVEVWAPAIQEYLGTYEIASANLEGLYFDHHNEIRDEKPGGTPGDNQAGNLNGNDPNRRIGTSMILKVMAGDKIEMNVNNFYERYESDNDDPVNASDMLATIINTLRVGTGGFVGSENHNIKTVTDVFNAENYDVYSQILNNNADPQKPRAYLNYVMFDENMQIMPDMSGAFQANGEGHWETIGTSAPLTFPSNGYMAVYLSNASKNISADQYGNVYFDQLVLRLSRGKLKEEVHYYPHGLPINGMGSVASGYTPNRKKYQSNDQTKEMNLSLMDFNARLYDPQIGRFLATDPLADARGQEMWSPYAAMANDPVNIVDPDGTVIIIREITVSNGNKLKYESAIYRNGILYNEDGSIYQGENAYILARAAELNTLRNNDPRFAKVISDLENHQLNGRDVSHIISNWAIGIGTEWLENGKIVSVLNGEGSQLQTMGDPYKNVIKFVPDIDRKNPRGSDFSNLQVLIHELKHDWNDSYGGGLKNKQLIPSANGGTINCEEVDGINFQNIQRKIEGLAPRKSHSGAEVPEIEKINPDKYKLWNPRN